MQRALVYLALLLVPVAASSASASSAASAWLRSHKSPTGDQLQELAGANPAAFAIVQALLSKHSHGAAQLAPEERGPDVFRRMMGEGSHIERAAPRVALPYASEQLAMPEVSAPVVDQAHYNPNSASDRDESSVQRLLNAVASMGGKKGKKIKALMEKKHMVSQESALADDASLFADAQPQAPPPMQAFEEPAAPVQAAPHKKKNSYLDGMDLSGDMPVAHHGAEQQAAPVDTSADSLASFSFQDAAAKEVAAPKPKPVAVAAAPKAKKDNNVFLKWLGVVNKAPAPEEQAVAAPVKKANSYLVGW